MSTTYDPFKFFPNDVLTHSEGKPTRASLTLLKRELKENARAIHSTRGTGNRGLERLLYDPQVYNARPAMANRPFVDPIHPGVTPEIPPGSLGPAISRILSAHTAALNDFTVFHSTDTALKKQAMQAVPTTYYKILEDPEEGFADITLLEFIDHLDTTHGSITTDKPEANLTNHNNQHHNTTNTT